MDLSNNNKFRHKKNGFLLVIDSMRFDTLNNLKKSNFLFPNLSNYFSKSQSTDCIANSNSTQFVMPALFTQSYPLDYGGYEHGIRSRPKTFIEVFKENKFSTFLMSNANQIGLGDDGYQRGFDEIQICPDFRTVIEQRVARFLRPKIKQLDLSDKSGNSGLQHVKEEYKNFIANLIKDIKVCDKSNWSAKLIKSNTKIVNSCINELEFLKKKPHDVKRRILEIPQGDYWRFIGREKLEGIGYYIFRIYSSLAWRLKSYISKKPNIFPFIWLGHISVKSEKLIPNMINKIKNLKRPWFIYCHIMDLHDGRDMSDVSFFLKRFVFLPKWLFARLTGKTNRRFSYDSALMIIDKNFKKILDLLIKDESIISVITADHGFRTASAWPNRKNNYEDKFLNMFQEDIKVPFAIKNSPKFSSSINLLDSMGVTATLLRALNIKGHESFKGKSLFKEGRSHVISEHAGRGHSDIINKDLYFAITSVKDKLFINLRKDELHLSYFDLTNDPEEKNNLVLNESYSSSIKLLLDQFILERGKVLHNRLKLLKKNKNESFVNHIFKTIS